MSLGIDYKNAYEIIHRKQAYIFFPSSAIFISVRTWLLNFWVNIIQIQKCLIMVITDAFWY